MRKLKEFKMKPIWYFVGLILLVMGLLILVNGIYFLINPPQTKTVLSETHPSIWWGLIMAAFGGLMFAKNKNKIVE